jgi:isoamylase
MLQAGDEVMRTQGGNNNAYCQDNDVSWLDWKRAATPEARRLNRFVARLIALRQGLPPLRPPVFLHGGQELAPGLSDIAWYDQHGQPMTPEAWGEPEARTLALRRAVAAPDGHLDITLLLLNADSAAQPFTLPAPDYTWRTELDTAAPDDGVGLVEGPVVTVAGRGVMLLAARLEAP